jgi:hypothetical protein
MDYPILAVFALNGVGKRMGAIRCKLPLCCEVNVGVKLPVACDRKDKLHRKENDNDDR